MTQRAIRRVRPDPVDDELVLTCIELAQHAPTGNNGQQWEFIVVKDPAVKEKLARRYRQAWNLYSRFALRHLVRSDDATRRTIKPSSAGRPLRRDPGPGGRLPAPRCTRGAAHRCAHAASGRIRILGIDLSSVQNLLLAARAMGLGASLTTMPLWNLTSVRRTLELPVNVTPMCIVPLGWPRGRYGPSARRPSGGHPSRWLRRPNLARATRGRGTVWQPVTT